MHHCSLPFHADLSFLTELIRISICATSVHRWYKLNERLGMDLEVRGFQFLQYIFYKTRRLVQQRCPGEIVVRLVGTRSGPA